MILDQAQLLNVWYPVFQSSYWFHLIVFFVGGHFTFFLVGWWLGMVSRESLLWFLGRNSCWEVSCGVGCPLTRFLQHLTKFFHSALWLFLPSPTCPLGSCCKPSHNGIWYKTPHLWVLFELAGSLSMCFLWPSISRNLATLKDEILPTLFCPLELAPPSHWLSCTWNSFKLIEEG